MRTVGLLTLGLLVGCGSSISGKVEGQGVGHLPSGYWYALGSGDSEIIVATVFSFPGACEAEVAVIKAQTDAYASYKNTLDQDALLDDLESAEQDNTPEDYWVFELGLDVDPDDVDEVENEYNINEDHEDGYLNAAHRQAYTDWEAVLVNQDPSGYHIATYYSEDGTAIVNKYKQDKLLKAQVEVQLQDVDKADVGDVTINYKVPYCPEVELALDDYFNELATF